MIIEFAKYNNLNFKTIVDSFEKKLFNKLDSTI